MLSHGQSEVERGFSINENILVDNMQMETIVAQKNVNDCMRKNNFHPHNMSVSKVSLQNAKQAHFRYKKPWTRSNIKRIKKALGLSKCKKK